MFDEIFLSGSKKYGREKSGKDSLNTPLMMSKSEVQIGSRALFDEVLTIRSIDPDGKKFRHVSRLLCENDKSKIKVLIDINIDLFSVDVNDRCQFLIVDSLFEGQRMKMNWCQVDEPSSDLVDQYSYVMSGQVYRIEKFVVETEEAVEEESREDEVVENIMVYVSFGGLLMRLEGPMESFAWFKNDSMIFLLMKKFEE
ncbi:hypothetical protein ACOME3_004396 [Neoechinorhynchus agilis]